MVRDNSRILLVEDDPSTQKLEQLIFEQEGYTVTIAGSGEEGLAVVTTVKPDLVVLDIGLPGMDGCTTCARIREVSSVPIIIVTGRYPSEDRVRGLESGADTYITKPFSPKELTATAAALLRRSKLSGGPRLGSTLGESGVARDSTGSTPDTLDANLDRRQLTVEYRLFYHLDRSTRRLRTLADRAWLAVTASGQRILPVVTQAARNSRAWVIRFWNSDSVTPLRDWRGHRNELISLGDRVRSAWQKKTNRKVSEGPPRPQGPVDEPSVSRTSSGGPLSCDPPDFSLDAVDPAKPVSREPAFEQATAPTLHLGQTKAMEDLRVGSPSLTPGNSRIQGSEPSFPAHAFLQVLFDAYVSYSRERSDSPLETASVVPLVDLLPFLDWPPQPLEEYSREEFTHDIYQLHNSGVIATPSGARVSFPISRGVPGKTLTSVTESGTEIRYFGVRFIQHQGQDPESAAEDNEDQHHLSEAEELQGLHFIKALLHDRVDVKRIDIRRLKTHSVILIDDNLQKPICRLRYSGGQKLLGIIDADKQEDQVVIKDIHEILNYADRLKQTAINYEGKNRNGKSAEVFQ